MQTASAGASVHPAMKTFPEVLMRMLNEEESTIRWLKSEERTDTCIVVVDAFRVEEKDRFMTDTLPKYFRVSK